VGKDRQNIDLNKTKISLDMYQYKK